MRGLLKAFLLLSLLLPVKAFAGFVSTGTVSFSSGANTFEQTYISSLTVYGTITSTSGFVGDGSKLTGISALGGMSLPFPQGATNYIQNGDVLQQGATFYVSSGTITNQVYIGSMTMLGTINTASNINVTNANITLGQGHLRMGGTFGSIMAREGGGSLVGIKFGQGGDFTGFQGFQSTVTFIAYDPSIPLQSGEVGRFSNKYWTFFSSYNNTAMVNISTESAYNSNTIPIFAVSSNTIKARNIDPTFVVNSGSVVARVPIHATQFVGDGSLLTGVTGSGSGTSISTMAASYKIVIGTTSLFGANCVGTDEKVFNFAISSLTYDNGTASGTIYVQAGDYNISNVTIPKYITIYAEKEARLHNRTNSAVFNIKGILDGGTLNYIQRAGTPDPPLIIKEGGDVYNLHMNLNFSGLEAIPAIKITGSSFSVLSGIYIDSFLVDNHSLPVRFMTIDESTSVFINNLFKPYGGYSTGGDSFIVITSGNDIKISDSYFNLDAGIVLAVNGVSYGSTLRNLMFDNNFISSRYIASSGGTILFSGGNEGVSTGTIISNNTFRLLPDGTNTANYPIIYMDHITNGVRIVNNNLTVDGADVSYGTFIKLTAFTKNTVIANNDVQGIGYFLDDSGRGTKVKGRMNFFNNVEYASEHAISSMTVYGTVSSTSGFVGDGSKLTNIYKSSGNVISMSDYKMYVGTGTLGASESVTIQLRENSANLSAIHAPMISNIDSASNIFISNVWDSSFTVTNSDGVSPHKFSFYVLGKP